VPVVFSSSAGVYGQPPVVPIPETTPKEPANVYGETKLVFERVLAAYDRAYGLRSISLRYFNACGAAEDGSIGEAHPNKSHLVELALLTALGQRESIKVFGTDYPTPDGTCIRDYIHVNDLASAHILAVRALEAWHERGERRLQCRRRPGLQRQGGARRRRPGGGPPDRARARPTATRRPGRPCRRRGQDRGRARLAPPLHRP
jgi:UDP-glucose 4-epimerase